MKTARILITVLFILLNNAHIGITQDSMILFEEANDAYEKGYYQKAIRSYESIVNFGIENAIVYYNLGNSYFKNRQLGKAILNYERALRINPNDEDIRYNLMYAKSFINQEETKKPPLNRFIQNLYQIFSLNELTIILSIMYFLLAVFLCLMILKKNSFLFWTNISLGIIFLLNFVWFYSRFYQEEITKSVIVIASESNVYNGPGEEYSIGFVVPEGKKLIILGKKEEWSIIGLKERGLKGWIHKDSIEKI